MIYPLILMSLMKLFHFIKKHYNSIQKNMEFFQRSYFIITVDQLTLGQVNTIIIS
jgi:hypothetical protein